MDGCFGLVWFGLVACLFASFLSVCFVFFFFLFFFFASFSSCCRFVSFLVFLGVGVERVRGWRWVGENFKT